MSLLLDFIIILGLSTDFTAAASYRGQQSFVQDYNLKNTSYVLTVIIVMQNLLQSLSRLSQNSYLFLEEVKKKTSAISSSKKLCWAVKCLSTSEAFWIFMAKLVIHTKLFLFLTSNPFWQNLYILYSSQVHRSQTTQ